DDGTGVTIASNFFRQVAKQGAQHFRGAFLRRHCEADCGQLHGRTSAHESLEQRGGVVRIAGSIVVGARSDVLVAAPIDEDRRRRDVVLLWALVELNFFAVEGTNGTVGRTEINTDVFHASTFLSITVPCLRKPLGPMMIGSTI